MAIQRYAGDRLTCLSGDTKPLNVADGAFLVETNTGKLYQKVSGAWTQIEGYSGTSGYSGASGISGFSGIGTSGYSGINGESGYSGESGISGFSGASGVSGFSGVGTSGYSGEAGPVGPTGGISMPYNYNDTTSAPPATGTVRLNHATLSSATVVWAHDTDSGSVNVQILLDDILPGDHIRIQKVGSPTNYAYYHVDTNVDSGAYHTIGVTYVSGSGSLTTGDAVEMAASQRGPEGQSGYSGESGTSGYSGATGTSGYSGIGTSGYSGESGTSGYSGINGTNGTNGTSGYSGESGASGFSGASGESGYSGASGASGFSGISGFSGQDGAGIQYWDRASTTITPTNAGDVVDLNTSPMLQEAQTAPGTPAADNMVVYVVATGTTPNRVVKWCVKDEAGNEVVLTSVIV